MLYIFVIWEPSEAQSPEPLFLRSKYGTELIPYFLYSFLSPLPQYTSKTTALPIAQFKILINLFFSHSEFI